MLTTDSVIPGASCQAEGCKQAGGAGGPVQHETHPVAAEIDGLKVRVVLCPKHREELSRLREKKQHHT
jgi:hypothetical protein